MYNFLLLIIIIVSIFCYASNKKNTDIELNIYFWIIFFFIGFRSIETGQDTQGYVESFMTIGMIEFHDVLEIYKTSNEIGYLVFIKLLYAVAPFEQSLLITQGALVALTHRYFIKRCCSIDYFFSTLIFMSFGLLSFHMTGIRQSIAMSLCVVAYAYLADRKYYKYGIWVLIASTFHFSAIIFLGTYIVDVFLKKFNLLMVTICSLGIILFAGKILNTVSQFRDKWAMYSSIEKTDNGYIFFLILMVILITSELVKSKMAREKQLHVKLHSLAFIFWSGRLVSRTFERPALYFIPASMVMLPTVIKYISRNRKNHSYIYIIAVLFVCALYIYRYDSTYYGFCFL